VHGTLERTGVSAEDFVVVIGPGPTGILTAFVAASTGATVALCGTSQDVGRLALAEALGIAHCFESGKNDVAQEVKRRTGGYGADVVLECSGSAGGARLGLDIVRKRGKFTQFGLFGRRIEIDFEQIAFKELRVTGSISQHRPAWETALQLMGRGNVPAEQLVSHDLPLDEWRQAFGLVESKQCIKAILRP
jgi:L-iditol 2-dehydrogenase